MLINMLHEIGNEYMWITWQCKINVHTLSKEDVCTIFNCKLDPGRVWVKYKDICSCWYTINDISWLVVL